MAAGAASLASRLGMDADVELTPEREVVLGEDEQLASKFSNVELVMGDSEMNAGPGVLHLTTR
jgi:hypothetical protein